MKPRIEVTSRFDEKQRSAIFDPLVEFNVSKVGNANYTPLNILVRDESDEIAGGLWGHTAYGWLYIELLYLPAHLRGIDIGRTIVSKAETEALSRDCKYSWVDTHEFQSRGFYETLGYICFGELPNYPDGYARYFMRKDLPEVNLTETKKRESET